MKKYIILILTMLCFANIASAAGISYRTPNKLRANITDSAFVLTNDGLDTIWFYHDGTDWEMGAKGTDKIIFNDIKITGETENDVLFFNGSNWVHYNLENYPDTIPNAHVSDSSGTIYNPKHLFGGFFRDELRMEIVTYTGTAYLKIDNDHDLGNPTQIWLSDDGEGGNVTMFDITLPDSIALNAGTATTVELNDVHYCYNAGSPIMAITSGAVGIIDVTGDLIDSCARIAEVGLGEVAGSSASIRVLNAAKAYLYKSVARFSNANRIVEYSGTGILPTVAAGGKNISTTNGWVNKLDAVKIPAGGTSLSHPNTLKLIVPVYADSNYATWDSLAGFVEYSDGTTILSNHKVWLVLWGAASDVDSTEFKYYLNIQSGTRTYTTVAGAEGEAWNAPTSIPEEFNEVGFLIASMIYNKFGDSIATLSTGSKFNSLLGQRPGVSGGGGGGTQIDSTTIKDTWNFYNGLAGVYEWMSRIYFDTTITGTDDSLIIATNAFDSSHIIANSLSMNGDLHQFSKAELEGRASDVSDFAEADGEVYTNTHDYTGATLIIPNGSNPTTDAKGEIAIDNNQGIKYYDSSLTSDVAQPSIHTFQFPLDQPDLLENDTIQVMYVHTDLYPHGIKLISIGMEHKQPFAYSVTFWEYTHPCADSGSESQIEGAIATGATECIAEDDGTLTDPDIAAGSRIKVLLPSTDVVDSFLWGTFYVKTGD